MNDDGQPIEPHQPLSSFDGTILSNESLSGLMSSFPPPSQDFGAVFGADTFGIDDFGGQFEDFGEEDTATLPLRLCGPPSEQPPPGIDE